MGPMATPPRLGHVAIAATDPQRLAGFYRELLDLQIVRQNSNLQVGTAVLLSGAAAEEDHELVLLTNPAAQHIAFRVDSLEHLRALYRRAKQHGLTVPYALDSGIALGFFIRDPEGNALEIYLPANAPHREVPPLTDPDEIDRVILGRR